jgi:sulfatase modifying factor 1
VEIAWSHIGNPGNSADPRDGDHRVTFVEHFGAVPYEYEMGTYEVTASQYVEFLNAKDPTGTNALGLFVALGSSTIEGFRYSAANPVGSKYFAVAGRENLPATPISRHNAMRFANWLNNGQGNGDTETGAYTMGALGPGGVPIVQPSTHNPGATIRLPTENEWYKAAYYNPALDSYFKFPTSSDSPPIDSAPTALPNHANYEQHSSFLTAVGAYSGTTSPYGLFDMAGNAEEWVETLMSDGDGVTRGGHWHSAEKQLLFDFRQFILPYNGIYINGFRLVAVPEPSTYVMAAMGIVALLFARRRKGSIRIVSP